MATTLPAPEPAYQYKGVILRVVDGDTAEVDIDLGFSVHTHEVVRFDGIDAPEVVGASKAAGLAAKEAVMKLLPVGTEVVLKTRKPANKSEEKFGRFLARVWVDGKDVCQELIDGGLVKAYSGGKR